MEVLVDQLCLTLCDSVDCSLQAPLSMGILQARVLEWIAMPSSRGASQSRDQAQVSRIASDYYYYYYFLPAELAEKLQKGCSRIKKKEWIYVPFV